MQKIKLFLALLLVFSICCNVFAEKQRINHSEDGISENATPAEAMTSDAHQAIEPEASSIPGLKEDANEIPTLDIEISDEECVEALSNTSAQVSTEKISTLKKILQNYNDATDTGSAIILGLLTWAKENIKDIKNLRKIYNSSWKGHKKYRFVPAVLLARIIAQFYGKNYKSILNKALLAFCVLALSESEPANLIEDLFGQVAA